jgi:hypothetical protein
MRLRELEEDRKFLQCCNIGGERMKDEDIARVKRIAAYRWRDVEGRDAPFLSDDEVKNLTIRAGTLTDDERKVINHHIVATIKMLEALPWPRHLTKVPEYAGGHHERMDGKGYPKGLTREQMSVQARCMGIADIFEALTAKDRPYKKGKTLSESLEILGRMRLNNHVDPDLFDVFVRRKVYRRYAEMFLDPEQIDDVDETRIPAISPERSRSATSGGRRFRSSRAKPSSSISGLACSRARSVTLRLASSCASPANSTARFT